MDTSSSLPRAPTCLFPNQSLGGRTNESVIAQIEAIFEGIIDGFFDSEHTHSIPIRVKTRTNGSRTFTTPDGNISYNIRLVNYPGRTAQEAWRFAVVVRILELIHEALINKVTISKRSIYYKDTKLFKDQRTVDRYVDILASTLGGQRANLNVVAVAKGLVIGPFTLTLKDRGIVNGGLESKALLIPDISTIVSISTPSACWVLVIEKDSAFQALATTNFHHDCAAGPGIMITGKGYPDISTRAFLHDLSLHLSCPPIFALVDFDPDGIAIMSTYRHGSFTLSHENEFLAVSSVRWLGPKSKDMCCDNGDEAKGLLRLTDRDRSKALGLLERTDKECEWRRELQVMLMVGFKAEIETLSERLEGLKGWVERRLGEEIGSDAKPMGVRVRGGDVSEKTLVHERVIIADLLVDPSIDGVPENTSTSDILREGTIKERENKAVLEQNVARVAYGNRKEQEKSKLSARDLTNNYTYKDASKKTPSSGTLEEELERKQPNTSTSTANLTSAEGFSQSSPIGDLANDLIDEPYNMTENWIEEEGFEDIMAEALGQMSRQQKDGRTGHGMLEEILLGGSSTGLDEDEEGLLAMPR